MHITRSAGVRRRLLHTTIIAGALVAPAAAAGQASAATLAMSAPCYVNVQSTKPAVIDITGTGFTPGDTIEVSGFGVAGNTVAGADGSINLLTAGPILPFAGPGQKSFPLQAQDETNPTGFIASTSVTVANFSIATNPSVAKPSRKVTWRFSGFTPGKTIYVHYLRKGKVLTRTAFGKAQAPCGTLKARDRFYPGGHPKYTKYNVVFDQVKRYVKSAPLRISTVLSFF